MNQHLHFVAFDRRTRFVLALILGVVATLCATPVLAATGAGGGHEINWWQMGLVVAALLVPYVYQVTEHPFERSRVPKEDHVPTRKFPREG